MTGPAHCHPDEGDMSWTRLPVNCRDVDTDVFFPKGKDESRPRAVYDRALTICDGCPAQQQCLEYALRTNQADGVWGGRTPDQRKQMRGPFMRTHRTCADCRTPIGHRGTQSQRCTDCQNVHQRQRQYEWAARRRLESPPT